MILIHRFPIITASFLESKSETFIGSCFETDWSFLFLFSKHFWRIFLTFRHFDFLTQKFTFPKVYENKMKEIVWWKYKVAMEMKQVILVYLCILLLCFFGRWYFWLWIWCWGLDDGGCCCCWWGELFGFRSCFVEFRLDRNVICYTHRIGRFDSSWVRVFIDVRIANDAEDG